MMKFLKITDNAKPIRKLLTAEELPPTQESPRLFENRTQYESILTSAREENKNMLLCFSSHFCAPCRHMESTTFRNPAIIEATNRQYITGYFETGDPKDQTLCHRYRNAQTVIPYLVIATPDEKIIRKRTGYMEELAACCNLSPNYFHTLFYKTFSTTPHAYMMRLKMNEATTLIINSELTMKEIAFRLGFLNDTYFSHVFKKYYHTTPGSFRKEFRNISFI